VRARPTKRSVMRVRSQASINIMRFQGLTAPQFTPGILAGAQGIPLDDCLDDKNRKAEIRWNALG
jgi:hypothetical protein